MVAAAVAALGFVLSLIPAGARRCAERPATEHRPRGRSRRAPLGGLAGRGRALADTGDDARRSACASANGSPQRAGSGAVPGATWALVRDPRARSRRRALARGRGRGAERSPRSREEVRGAGRAWPLAGEDAAQLTAARPRARGAPARRPLRAAHRGARRRRRERPPRGGRAAAAAGARAVRRAAPSPCERRSPAADGRVAPRPCSWQARAWPRQRRRACVGDSPSPTPAPRGARRAAPGRARGSAPRSSPAATTSARR